MNKWSDQQRARATEAWEAMMPKFTSYHNMGIELARQRDELLASLKAALAWIDAVPADIQLPAMPGFDRDAVNELIAKAEAL